MTKHDKHAHAAIRPGDPTKAKDGGADYESLDELAGSTDLLKTSLLAGNEMKIAVGVIGVLLVIFAAAMVKWMRHSTSPAPADEAAAKEHDKTPAVGDKDGKEFRDSPPFGPGGHPKETKVLAATSAPAGEVRPKPRAGDPENWPSAPGDKFKSPQAADDRTSLPSFKSRPKLGELSHRDENVPERGAGKSLRGDWAKDKGTDATTGNPLTGASTSDPFRNRPAVDGLRRENSVATGAPSTRVGSASDGLRGAPRSGDPTAPSRTSLGSNPLRFSDSGAPAPAASNRAAGADAGGLANALTAPGQRSDTTSSADARSRRANVSVSPNMLSVPGTRKTYVVQPGDNIYEIARQELGKASRWREIYDLNRDALGTRSLELAPGTQLVLPDAGPATVSQRNDSGRLR